MVKLRHIPNAITSIRLLLVVPIAFFIAEESHCIALILFAISGLSDGLDGFLARQFGWVSTFGRLIDPLADKLMMVTTTTASTKRRMTKTIASTQYVKIK